MLRLYNTAISPVRAGLALWSRLSRRRDEWDERMARRLPRAGPDGIWLHGASVGEARLSGLIAAGLRQRDPGLALYASAVTRTGRARLDELESIDAAFYVPVDLNGLPSRLLGALRPSVVALIETELWPNLLHETQAAGVPVAVANGRLSASRMNAYRRLRRLFGPLLARIARVGAQTGDDAERFVELGVARGVVEITGNIKYDLPGPSVGADELRSRFGLDPERPVLIAGSTGVGEEEMVLDAFRAVRRQVVRPWLLLAPRYPARADEIAALVAGRGLACHRLSRGRDREAGAADVLLVDTLGELAALYALGRAAFVGGSLVPLGGHNVLEPVAAGVPVLFGPHVETVREPAEALVEAGGGREVGDGAQLERAWLDLLDDATHARMARAARSVVEGNRGALERTLELLCSLLPEPAQRAMGAP